MSIEEIIRQRGIMHLMHFTRVDNLQSILEYGLIPRAFLNEEHAAFNDSYRFDNCENAVCTTIEFPNYKMFYQLRCDNPDTQWAVLRLDAQILTDFDCAFCQVNAGSAASFTIPLQERKGAEALAKLYAPVVDGVRRSPLIPASYPTSPQAEVLVFDTIPPDYIEAVYFDNTETLRFFKKMAFSVHMSVDEDWFYGRADYRQWQNSDQQ